MTGTARPGRLFCFGFGYSAACLAALLEPEGWDISGTGRDPGRTHGTGGGMPILPFDGTAATREIEAALAEATHVLSSIPPGDDGDPVLRHFADALGRAGNLCWVGYLSTTGVYGDSAGAWVDEETPPAPTVARARRRLAAETAWRALHETGGVPVHVFRLAGIYGPGRSAIDQLRAGTARRVVKPGHVVSRIHVADVAATLAASMARPDPGRIYNLCDDEPAPSADVIAHAAELMGCDAPPEVAFDDPSLSEMARSFYVECRRVRNDRIKRELGIVLRYPDYRAGLAAILGAPVENA